jgi:hypothetical protein
VFQCNVRMMPPRASETTYAALLEFRPASLALSADG